MALLCNLLTLYLVAVFARIILSYFPLEPGSAMSSVYGVLYSITEPVLGPLRRVVPSLGMFDITPMIVVIGVRILQAAVLGC